MLQSLHDKLKGWASAVIIGLISVVFVLWGISYYFEGGSAEGPTVAEVGDIKISQYQLQNELNQLRQNLAAQGKADLNNPQYEKIALNQLVSRQLQKQGALDLGIRVSTAQIDQQITQLPYFQENGKFSKEKYEAFLQSSGYTLPMLRSMLMDNLLSYQTSVGMISSDFILPDETTQMLNLYFQNRKVNYVSIPYDKVNLEIKVTDKEIKQYYEHNQARFMEPEKVKVQYVLLTLKSIEERINVTESQIKAYYDSNKTKWATKNGNKTEQKPLTDVREKIIQILKEEQAKVLYSSIGNQMANIAYQYPDSLNQAAKEAKVEIQETAFFSREEGKGIAESAKVRQIAFSNEVLKNKYNSDVINLSPTEAVIIHLSEYQPEKKLALSQVKNEIKTILSQSKIKLDINEKAIQVINQLNDGKSITSLANVKLNWQEQRVNRQDKQLPMQVVENIMSQSLNEKRQTKYILVPTNDSVFLYKILNVSKINKSDKNYYQIKLQNDSMVQNRQSALDYQAYLNYLYQTIQVKINNQKTIN
ncbi:SurA N-terminal domain-containing protein [Thiotrichales bacterium 19S11-10]|nr:SurA N-terminal domain-containing protein [Thiotrichales bacterium 19S11-10]